MKNFDLFLFIIFLSKISIFLFSNEFPLDGDYPFSIKTGDSDATTFMNKESTSTTDQEISIYTVGNSNPIAQHSLPTTNPCISTEEKGAIYYKGYYYLSCLQDKGSENFQINVYDNTFQHVITYPNSTHYYTFITSSSIRFFKKESRDDLIGVVWLANNADGKMLHLLEINEERIISYSTFSVDHIARVWKGIKWPI